MCNLHLPNKHLSSRHPPLKNGYWALFHSKHNRGFTLIELLVVILIVAVLSAMALPQMLQIIGRSRESEARSLMGAMNRAQQAYFNERQSFARTAVQLEVPVGNEKYYTVFVNATNSFTVGGLQGAKGINNQSSGTRDYAAAVGYDPINRIYSSVICRSIDRDNNYEISGLRSLNQTIGTGRVIGARFSNVAGVQKAICVEAAGVETLE